MAESLQECSKSYVIGSGWWCGENKERLTFGDEKIRNSSFHKIWYQSIKKFSNPEKIFIVDSNSPIKPDIISDDIEFISLNTNSGHSTNMQSGAIYCGWTASSILSMQYALHCDCDYFVYVEQDCLLYGEGIVERQIKRMEDNDWKYIFGDGKDSYQPLQVSFFIIRKDFIPELLSKFFSIRHLDSKVSPELKLSIAVNHYLSLMPNFLLNYKLIRSILSRIKVSNFMDCGFGRDRPIDFENEFFYFQQGSEEEIKAYLSMSEFLLD